MPSDQNKDDSLRAKSAAAPGPNVPNPGANASFDSGLGHRRGGFSLSANDLAELEGLDLPSTRKDAVSGALKPKDKMGEGRASGGEGDESGQSLDLSALGGKGQGAAGLGGPEKTDQGANAAEPEEPSLDLSIFDAIAAGSAPPDFSDLSDGLLNAPKKKKRRRDRGDTSDEIKEYQSRFSRQRKKSIIAEVLSGKALDHKSLDEAVFSPDKPDRVAASAGDAREDLEAKADKASMAHGLGELSGLEKTLASKLAPAAATPGVEPLAPAKPGKGGAVAEKISDFIAKDLALATQEAHKLAAANIIPPKEKEKEKPRIRSRADDWDIDLLGSGSGDMEVSEEDIEALNEFSAISEMGVLDQRKYKRLLDEAKNIKCGSGAETADASAIGEAISKDVDALVEGKLEKAASLRKAKQEAEESRKKAEAAAEREAFERAQSDPEPEEGSMFSSRRRRRRGQDDLVSFKIDRKDLSRMIAGVEFDGSLDEAPDSKVVLEGMAESVSLDDSPDAAFAAAGVDSGDGSMLLDLSMEDLILASRRSEEAEDALEIVDAPALGAEPAAVGKEDEAGLGAKPGEETERPEGEGSKRSPDSFKPRALGEPGAAANDLAQAIEQALGRAPVDLGIGRTPDAALGAAPGRPADDSQAEAAKLAAIEKAKQEAIEKAMEQFRLSLEQIQGGGAADLPSDAAAAKAGERKDRADSEPREANRPGQGEESGQKEAEARAAEGEEGFDSAESRPLPKTERRSGLAHSLAQDSPQEPDGRPAPQAQDPREREQAEGEAKAPGQNALLEAVKSAKVSFNMDPAPFPGRTKAPAQTERAASFEAPSVSRSTALDAASDMAGMESFVSKTGKKRRLARAAKGRIEVKSWTEGDGILEAVYLARRSERAVADASRRYLSPWAEKERFDVDRATRGLKAFKSADEAKIGLPDKLSALGADGAAVALATVDEPLYSAKVSRRHSMYRPAFDPKVVPASPGFTDRIEEMPDCRKPAGKLSNRSLFAQAVGMYCFALIAPDAFRQGRGKVAATRVVDLPKPALPDALDLDLRYAQAPGLRHWEEIPQAGDGADALGGLGDWGLGGPQPGQTLSDDAEILALRQLELETDKEAEALSKQAQEGKKRKPCMTFVTGATELDPNRKSDPGEENDAAPAAAASSAEAPTALPQVSQSPAGVEGESVGAGSDGGAGQGADRAQAAKPAFGPAGRSKVFDFSKVLGDLPSALAANLTKAVESEDKEWGAAGEKSEDATSPERPDGFGLAFEPGLADAPADAPVAGETEAQSSPAETEAETRPVDQAQNRTQGDLQISGPVQELAKKELQGLNDFLASGGGEKEAQAPRPEGRLPTQTIIGATEADPETLKELESELGLFALEDAMGEGEDKRPREEKAEGGAKVFRIGFGDEKVQEEAGKTEPAGQESDRSLEEGSAPAEPQPAPKAADGAAQAEARPEGAGLSVSDEISVALGMGALGPSSHPTPAPGGVGRGAGATQTESSGVGICDEISAALGLDAVEAAAAAALGEGAGSAFLGRTSPAGENAKESATKRQGGKAGAEGREKALGRESGSELSETEQSALDQAFSHPFGLIMGQSVNMGAELRSAFAQGIVGEYAEIDETPHEIAAEVMARIDEMGSKNIAAAAELGMLDKLERRVIESKRQAQEEKKKEEQRKIEREFEAHEKERLPKKRFNLVRNLAEGEASGEGEAGLEEFAPAGRLEGAWGGPMRAVEGLPGAPLGDVENGLALGHSAPGPMAPAAKARPAASPSAAPAKAAKEVDFARDLSSAMRRVTRADGKQTLVLNERKLKTLVGRSLTQALARKAQEEIFAAIDAYVERIRQELREQLDKDIRVMIEKMVETQSREIVQKLKDALAGESKRSRRSESAPRAAAEKGTADACGAALGGEGDPRRS